MFLTPTRFVFDVFLLVSGSFCSNVRGLVIGFHRYSFRGILLTAPASPWWLSSCGYALLSATLGASLDPRVCSAVSNSPASGLSSSIICVTPLYPSSFHGILKRTQIKTVWFHFTGSGSKCSRSHNRHSYNRQRSCTSGTSKRSSGSAVRTIEATTGMFWKLHCFRRLGALTYRQMYLENGDDLSEIAKRCQRVAVVIKRAAESDKLKTDEQLFHAMEELQE